MIIIVGTVANSTLAPDEPRNVAPRTATGGESDHTPCPATVTWRPQDVDVVRDPAPPDGLLIDLRGTVLRGQQDTSAPDVNLKPVNVGPRRPARDLCIWGGTIIGSHDRGLPWGHLKHAPGGGDHPAVRVAIEGWALIDGIRIENMMNGVRPVGDGLVLRNVAMRHIRDDCLANDGLHEVRVVDSLLDGCFTAFSARPESGSPLWQAGPDRSTLRLERVLVRLTPMPGGTAEESYGHLFKWSPVSGPVTIEDSIIAVDAPPHDVGSRLDWPASTSAENVTLIWMGPGAYPGRLPASGVTVTRDVTTWEAARTDWLHRHGCRSFSDCDLPSTLASLP